MGTREKSHLEGEGERALLPSLSPPSSLELDPHLDILDFSRKAFLEAMGLFPWPPSDSASGALSGDGSASKRRATAAGKKGPKDALRSLPDLYFSPFIVSFQLQCLLKFTVTGVSLWEESSERMEPAQLC